MDPSNNNEKSRDDPNIVDLTTSDIDDDSSVVAIFVKVPRNRRCPRSSGKKSINATRNEHIASDTVDLVSSSKEIIDVEDSSEEDSSVGSSRPTADSLVTHVTSPSSPVRKRRIFSHKSVILSNSNRASPINVQEKTKMSKYRSLNASSKTNPVDSDIDDDTVVDTTSPRKSISKRTTDSSSQSAYSSPSKSISRRTSDMSSQSANSDLHIKRSNRSKPGLSSKASATNRETASRPLRPRISKINQRTSSTFSDNSDSSSDIDVSLAENLNCFEDSASSSKSDENNAMDDVISLEKSLISESNICRDQINGRTSASDRKKAAIDKIRPVRTTKRARLLDIAVSPTTKRTLRPRKAKVLFDDTEHDTLQLDCKPPAKVAKVAIGTETEVDNKQDLPSLETDSSVIDIDMGLNAESNDFIEDINPKQIMFQRWEQLEEPAIWKFKCPSEKRNSIEEQKILRIDDFELSKEAITFQTRKINNMKMVCGGESRFFATRYRRRKYLDLVQWIPMRYSNQRNDKLETSDRPAYCSVYTLRHDP